MNNKIFSLALALLIVGCATQQEIRYYRSYNKSPEFTSYIQGEYYKLWYDEEIHAQFTKIEKGSDEWKTVQKSVGIYMIDYLFINRESSIAFTIMKSRYRIPCSENLKESGLKIIESDQRLVNNTPTLYMRVTEEKDDSMMMCMYCINSKLSTLAFFFACPTESWEEEREGILKALNGIELD